jgi:hypothetical protein
MKRELTLTDIAGYLPYGLKLLDRKRGMTTVWEWQSAACCDWNGEEKVEMISGEKYSEELVMASPILRPMSDLYKEITDKDYNGGEPFVPIVELANLLGESKIYQWKLHSDGRCAFSPEAMDYFRWLEEEKSFIHSLSYCEFSTGYVIFNQHEMYDLLHRLHFDYRGLIPVGLAVSVHDLPTNPYET